MPSRTTRLLDGKFSRGFEALTALTRCSDFTMDLVDAILAKGGAERAIRAMKNEFFPWSVKKRAHPRNLYRVQHCPSQRRGPRQRLSPHRLHLHQQQHHGHLRRHHPHRAIRPVRQMRHWALLLMVPRPFKQRHHAHPLRALPRRHQRLARCRYPRSRQLHRDQGHGPRALLRAHHLVGRQAQ